MRLFLILLPSLLVICTAEVYRKDRNAPTEKPSERRLVMPPKTIKIKISPRTTPQPLISLYKTYVGKKSLMRKFVPLPRMTEAPVKVTRRPLMKQRELIVGSVTVKPRRKEDIHITLRRRVNFKPAGFVRDTKKPEPVKIENKGEPRTPKVNVPKEPTNEDKDAEQDNKEFIFLKPNDSVTTESDKVSN